MEYYMGIIGASYATAANYRAAVRRTDTADDTQILVDLTSISRHIDRVLGLPLVGFNRDASDTTRHQNIDTLVKDKMLWLDVPLSGAPTSITIDTDDDGDFADESALDLTEFTGDVIYHPMGFDAGEVVPITGIEMTRNATTHAAHWPQGKLVRIIGRYGWPDVPDQIISATIHLAELLRLEGARSTGQITAVDSVINASAPAHRIITDLMATYKNAGGIF